MAYMGKESKKSGYMSMWASQVVLVVKSTPANVGGVRDMDSAPGEEDPLGKGRATHSSILAWRIPWREEPGRVKFIGSQSQTRLEQLSTHVHMLTDSLCCTP